MVSRPSAAAIAANLARVRDRIADAGGDPSVVTVVAMTKGHGLPVVEAACAAGLRDLGENYAQDLRAKADAGSLPADLRWHFAGRLQTNKVRVVSDLVWCWHSVDRDVLVDQLARRSPGTKVLVQVAFGSGRGGADPVAVPDLVARARDSGLDVRGLMTMGLAGDPAATASAFATVAGLADRLELPERSMGMSADLELAVAAGATMVRVGTGLFGSRPDPAGTP